MLKTIEGIYQNGQIQLASLPQDISERSQVLVTFLDPNKIDPIKLRQLIDNRLKIHHLPNNPMMTHHYIDDCFILHSSTNMRSFLLTLALMCFATPAVAATCEESFQKKGDFFNGAAFSARVEVEGLSVERAFSQLRPILARESIKTISTDVSTGVMKAENPATAFQRALPIDVFASADGTLLTVEMIFTIPSGVGASRDTVKKYLCGALNQLLPKSK